MAYLIECDRCGSTRSVTSTSSTPKQWLQFHDLELGEGVDALRQPIKGGVFCDRCVNDLRKWREPIPQGIPDRGI